MATLSSVLAWRMPGTGEPGGLPSMGSQSRTRLNDLAVAAAAAASTPTLFFRSISAILSALPFLTAFIYLFFSYCF